MAEVLAAAARFRAGAERRSGALDDRRTPHDDRGEGAVPVRIARCDAPARSPAGRRGAPQRGGASTLARPAAAAVVAPALLLAFPAAAAAALATALAGGGLSAAIAAYALGGAVALVSSAAAVAAPWRGAARRVRGFAARLAAAAGPAPARLFGR